MRIRLDAHFNDFEAVIWICYSYSLIITSSRLVSDLPAWAGKQVSVNLQEFLRLNGRFFGGNERPVQMSAGLR